MDLFDETTKVLDSWDLLNYPRLNTNIKRNKEIVIDSNLKRFASSSSLLLKKTPYRPDFSNIAAGHYPVCETTHRNLTSVTDKPLIKVTVVPKHPQTAHKRRKQPTKRKAFANHDHNSISSNKNIYLLVPAIPGSKEDKLYAIYTTKLNDKIIKEVNFSNLLSKCIIKSHILKEMNKNKKKSSEKKEKGQIKPIPVCSPDCAYVNIMGNTQNVHLNRSGSESPRPTARSSYKIDTTIKSSNSISSQDKRTEKRQLRSPDRDSLKDGIKTKSPSRSSRQQTKINFYQMESNGKNGTVKSPDRFSFTNDMRSIESVINETKRRSPERSDERDPNPRRPGRIRITGRLGLTNDDKCVLKCDATLDDKPIVTQFQGMACDMQPLCVQTCNKEHRSPRKQRDSIVQARDQQQVSGVSCYSLLTVGKESQATQVDFQILCSTSKNTRSNVIQKCACVNTMNIFDNDSDDEKRTGTALKKQNSPIIVISVYPKNEISTENTGDLKQQDIKTAVQKRENKKIGRSRSPSPTKSIKKIGGKKSETRVNASSSKKIVLETTKKDTRSKDNQSQNKNVVRSRSKTVTKSKTESKTNHSKTTKSQKSPPQSRRSKSPQNPVEPKVTEQIKKALVDDFTKSYTEQINQRNTRLDIPLQTKHNVSNITIDIEGDSEYYNVKLAQDVGKVNTEFTVRKANKGNSTGEVATGEADKTSLENFLYVKPDNEPRKRSFSQTLMFDGTDLMADNLATEGNELNVRDSIEISHRREHRASIASERETIDVSKEVDTEYLAPIKHFPGDECSVSDPNERDKEIRKLLEIDNAIKKDPLRFRSSKTTTLLEKCGQVTFQSICESFSGTTQTKNSTTTLKNIEKTDMEKHLSHTAKTVTLNRPMYQVIWNQNGKLLYQLNWRKHKSIILTRRQYVNVKKTIYNTLIQKNTMLVRAKRYNHDRRLYAGGSITAETKSIVLHYDKETQTEKAADALNKPAQADIRSDTYTFNEISNCGDAISIFSKEEAKFNANSSNELSEYSTYAKWTRQAIHFDTYMHNVQRTILMAQNEPLKKYVKEEYRRKATSVKEIQCQTVSVERQRVKFSSSDTADYRSRGQTVEKNDSCSIHTIFKNHQKSVTLTPNLGTSAYSLQDENSVRLKPRLKFFEDSIDQDPKPKKPLLRRLISCLVFRVFPASQQPKIPTMLVETHGPSSSFDSYHIGTSFGAVEMNSSLYDTTGSFYSDHTVGPITKTKRGFLDSVRGIWSRKT